MIRQSPAKVNLFLRVVGKREDGFHELCSLMAPIDLQDEVEILMGGEGIRVFCSHPGVPEDHTNLAHRAAVLFYSALAEKTGSSQSPRVAVTIDKKIPPGGGLGGGSSNGATVLMALNEVFSQPFSQKELMDMGLALGADCPFFMIGGPAIATGVGEKLVLYEDLPPLYLVVCDPGVPASTAEVFKNYDFKLTSGPRYNMNTGLNLLSKGQGVWGRENLQNDLEGSACELYPEIGSAKEEMGMLLQRKVYMSGSGSSLFALYPGAEEARQAYALLDKKWSGKNKEVYLSMVSQ